MTTAIKRILVATDFSLGSDAAVAYGLALAKTVHASIHLLHVVDNPIAAACGRLRSTPRRSRPCRST
jgi:nucleotide-binding universal stress UspA family protein